MRIIKTLFLIAVLPFVSLSQDIQWKKLTGLPPCFLLREGANGKLFAMGDSYVYSSTNDGLSWDKTSIPLSYMRELASHNQISIAGVNVNANFNNQAYLTTDNGVSWNRIYAAHDGYGNYMISDSDIIYGFVEIPDQGYKLVKYSSQKWDTLGTMIPRVATYFQWSAIDHSNTIIVEGGIGYGGILISKDYGATWQTAFASQSVSAGCVSPGNTIIVGISQTASENLDGGVYTSTDHGSSWVDIGLKDKRINSATADSAGNIYVATSVGIYGYRSATKMWEYLGPSETELVDILAARSGSVFSVSFNYGYPSDQEVLYRSVDKGGFWSPSSAEAFAIFSLITSPSGNILAGTLGDRIIMSMNGGASWVQLPPGSIAGYIYSFALDGSTIYAATDEGLFSSTDDGVSWKNLTDRAFSGSAYSVAIQSDGRIIIGTNFGIYISTDNGNSWTPSGLNTSKVLFLANNKSDIVYASTDNSGMLSSTDNGNTWHSLGLMRDDIQTIVVNDVGDVFVGVYGGVLRSTNNGASWTQSIFTNTYVYTIGFNGLQDVYAGTYNGLFRMRYGQTWTKIGFNGQTVLALAFDNSHNLLAGLYQGGIYMSTQPVTTVELLSGELPALTRLEQNYPNPFNPTTNFKLQIASLEFVSLKVYDILGREVATLLEEIKQPGLYEVIWDASGFASGVYYYKLSAGNFSEMKKMVLVR
jgi:photosystem II stability/assembly factor-like uncharacterized protein